MVYDWKYKMSIKAQTVGEHFEELEKRNGSITPKIVLDSARSESSVIHSCFEWNDGIAAEKYRETQAGNLIRNLTVKIIDFKETESLPVRAYVNFKDENASPFVHIQQVLKDEALSTKMLEQAKSELQSFKVKYKTLSELANIFHAIDEL